jgi:hypothetical protein
MRAKFSCLFLLITFSYCAEQQYPQKFPVVLTEVSRNANRAELVGIVRTLGVNQNIIEYGFVWGKYKPEINGAKLAIPQNIRIGKYNTFISEADLDSGIIYKVRAFVRTGDLNIYGNEASFTARTETVVIDSFTPSEGFPDSELIIRGKNFSTVNSRNEVVFGDWAAQVLSSSDTLLRIKVPTFIDDYKVGVRLRGQTHYTRTSSTFKILGPRINSLSTLSAKAGDVITAQGELFSQGDQIFFQSLGQNVAAVTTIISDNSLQFMVPNIVGTFRVALISTNHNFYFFPQKFTIH